MSSFREIGLQSLITVRRQVRRNCCRILGILRGIGVLAIIATKKFDLDCIQRYQSWDAHNAKMIQAKIIMIY